MTVGTDIIEISRIEKNLENKKFIERIYSEREIEYFSQKGFKAESMAGNFCAKEAFMKCLGTGMFDIPFKEISVLRNENGKPYISLSGKAKELLDKSGMQVDVSISHCKEYATAVCILF